MTQETRSTGRSGDPSVRVRESLDRHALDTEIIEFDRSTKTAAMAAEAVGCELGQIVKSLVFVASGRPVLVLVAGDRRGDVTLIASQVDAEHARIADADTVREATGYTIGGVSPFDLPDGLPVLLDESLGRFEMVYAAAGTPNSVVPVRLEDLRQVTRGTDASVTEAP